MTEPSETYSLCISFTRSGLKRRVPWVFVIYKTGDKQGIRLRVKDISEESTTKNEIALKGYEVGYAFLARENAYVDNYSSWGRIEVKTGLSKAERDSFKNMIETHKLSEMVGGFRDCQKWVLEALEDLRCAEELVPILNGCLGKDIYHIKDKVEAQGLWEFLKGPSFKSKEEAELDTSSLV